MRDDQLHAFLGEARARAAVAARRRRHWLTRQLEEDRTFAAVCSRAFEDARPVDVIVTTGRTHRGRLVAADAGIVAVATADGGTVYIAATAIVGLRPRPGAPARAKEPGQVPAVVPGATIADVVRELSDWDARVEVGTTDGGVHRGRIDGVGRDVLRLTGGMHLRLDMVTEVSSVP